MIRDMYKIETQKTKRSGINPDLSLSFGSNYLSVTFAPSASSFVLISSASALAAASLTILHALIRHFCRGS